MYLLVRLLPENKQQKLTTLFASGRGNQMAGEQGQKGHIVLSHLYLLNFKQCKYLIKSKVHARTRIHTHFDFCFQLNRNIMYWEETWSYFSLTTISGRLRKHDLMQRLKGVIDQLVQHNGQCVRSEVKLCRFKSKLWCFLCDCQLSLYAFVFSSSKA